MVRSTYQVTGAGATMPETLPMLTMDGFAALVATIALPHAGARDKR